HRTRPRMAPLLEIADPDRLSARALWDDPAGSDRQAARLRDRARLASVGPHVSLPVRDPRAELRPEVARLPTRRVRSGDALAARHDLESTSHRAVPGICMVVSAVPVQRSAMVRHAAP